MKWGKVSGREDGYYFLGDSGMEVGIWSMSF